MKTKTKPVFGALSFNHKKLIDLPGHIDFEVSEDNALNGARRNGEECPGALGIKSTAKLEGRKCVKAEVHRAVVYMDFGDEYSYRGYPSSALRREAISQDKGGSFDPGWYRVRRLSDYEIKRRARGSKGSGSPQGRPGHKRKTKVKNMNITGRIRDIGGKPIKHVRKPATSSPNITRSKEATV